MGGDDLASDDDYLVTTLKSEDLGQLHNDEAFMFSSPIDDKFPGESTVGLHQQQLECTTDDFVATCNKRKRDFTVEHGKQHPHLQTSLSSSSGQKRRKKERLGEPLRMLGHKILDQSAEYTAKLLSHYTDITFSPEHIARPLPTSSTDSKYGHNFMDRLLRFISKKQLKKTSSIKMNPKVVVLCLSARRCVEVLKDLAPLRLRIAKLFPKQGSIDEQARQLENTIFAMAVGTPHRIKEIMEHRSFLMSKGSVLFVLDTFENDKSFSVYTLADTSRHTQELLKKYVHPQCHSNKEAVKIGRCKLKVAFV